MRSSTSEDVATLEARQYMQLLDLLEDEKGTDDDIKVKSFIKLSATFTHKSNVEKMRKHYLTMNRLISRAFQST